MKTTQVAALFVIPVLVLMAATGPPEVSAETAHPPEVIQAPAEESTTRGVLDIAPWSVDSGGGESSGGTFAIVAAVGQHDTGLANACGRVLDGGVWSAGVDLQPLFCDGFESGLTDSWSNAIPFVNPADDIQTPGGE